MDFGRKKMYITRLVLAARMLLWLQTSQQTFCFPKLFGALFWKWWLSEVRVTPLVMYRIPARPAAQAWGAAAARIWLRDEVEHRNRHTGTHMHTSTREASCQSTEPPSPRLGDSRPAVSSGSFLSLGLMQGLCSSVSG